MPVLSVWYSRKRDHLDEFLLFTISEFRMHSTSELSHSWPLHTLMSLRLMVFTCAVRAAFYESLFGKVPV